MDPARPAPAVAQTGPQTPGGRSSAAPPRHAPQCWPAGPPRHSRGGVGAQSSAAPRVLNKVGLAVRRAAVCDSGAPAVHMQSGAAGPWHHLAQDGHRTCVVAGPSRARSPKYCPAPMVSTCREAQGRSVRPAQPSQPTSGCMAGRRRGLWVHQGHQLQSKDAACQLCAWLGLPAPLDAAHTRRAHLAGRLAGVCWVLAHGRNDLALGHDVRVVALLTLRARAGQGRGWRSGQQPATC
jgi:hypothetical protein